MGRKGDRASKEPLAKELFARGSSLAAISPVLDVSENTLGRWKAESKRPSEDADDWELARRQRQSRLEQLRTLFDRELQFAQEQPAGTVTSAQWDSLQKLGGMVKRWEEIEQVERQREQGPTVEIDRPKLFLENLEWLARHLKDTDPEGLKVLARNFDHLVIAFKAEHARPA